MNYSSHHGMASIVLGNGIHSFLTWINGLPQSIFHLIF